MKILIVEDEELAVSKLQRIVSKFRTDINVAGITDSVRSTVKWLQENDTPDLILMDIQLLDGNSFEIYKHVKVSSPVIFITSYNEHALRAFKVNSIDYLLKPIQKPDIEAALIKFENLKKIYGTEIPRYPAAEQLLKDFCDRIQPKEYRRRFLVRQANKLMTIDVQKIAYFYSDGRLNYIKSHDNEKYILSYTLDELENMLAPSSYFRISRAFYISPESISQIGEHAGNRLCLDLKPRISKSVIVSREKVTSFKRWIGK